MLRGNGEVRKSIRKAAAFVLAAAVTVTSGMPVTLLQVSAKEAEITANPFNQNVALGAEVTVTYPDDGSMDTSEGVKKLVDGDSSSLDNYWESVFKESTPGIRDDRPAEILLDLKEENLLDHVALYWRQTAPAKSYQVLVSADKREWNVVGTERSIPDNWVEETAQMDYTFTPQQVRYVKVSCTETSAYGVYTLREVEAYTIGGVQEELKSSYAKKKPAAACAEQGGAISLINDGDPGTRWATGDLPEGSEAWFYIDLEEVQTINEVKLNWEGAYASEYKLEVATDETAVLEENLADTSLWSTVGDYTISGAGEQTHSFADVPARYVRLTGTTATVWGLSIWEMEVNRIRENLPAEAVYISQPEALLKETGESLQLYAQVLPANADDLAVVWSSSNPEVAEVDANGLVTAKNFGIAEITAETGNGKKAVCALSVATQLGAPTSVTAEKAEDQILVQWNKVEHADSYQIYRAEDDAAFVLVDTVGDVAAYTDEQVEAGYSYTYKVKAVNSVADSGYAASEFSGATETITLPLSVTAVTLDKSTAELLAPGTLKLKASVLPERATNKNVIFTSSEPKVAGVSADGTVTAVSAGTAVITVTTEDGQKTAECVVSVQEKLGKASVTAKKTDEQEITVTWTAVSHAASYDVYRSAGKDGAFTLLASDVAELTYTDAISEELPGNTYRYFIIAKPESGSALYIDGEASQETDAVQIGELSPFGVNVALHKPVAVTSETSAEFSADLLTDGSATMEHWWESAKKEGAENLPNIVEDYEQNVEIDLRETETIDCVKIYWRAAVPASQYSICVSKDGKTYETVAERTAKAEGAGDVIGDAITFPAVEARYVKLVCEKTSSYACYGIHEIEVYTQGTVEGDPDTVTGLLISKSELTKKKGEKAQLYAQKLPANAVAEVVWESSNPEIATVSSTGKVTAVSAGTAVITASCGGESVVCQVLVTEQLAAPELLSQKAEDYSSITVTWNKVPKAEGYILYRSSDGGNIYSEVAAAEFVEEKETVSYTDTALTQGATYCYRVKAVNGAEYYLTSEFSNATEGILIPVAVTDVTLTAERDRIAAGEQLVLKTTVLPENATNQQVSYRTSDAQIASVEDGVVTGLAVGEAVITVTTADGGKTAEFAVTVTKQLQTPGAAAVLSEDESAITVSWKEIAHADSYKVYRNVNSGEYEEIADAEISLAEGTVSCTDRELVKGNSYSYQVSAVSESKFYPESEVSGKTENIFVPVHVEGIRFDETAKTMLAGESLTFSPVIEPENASNQSVSWESLDERVATVTDGVVKAVSVGETVITAVTKDGGFAASVTVTVRADLEAPKVTAVKRGADALLTWDVVAHAAGYIVYKSTDGATWNKLAEVTTAGCEDKNLAIGTYYYQVTAKGAGYYNDSARSNTVSVENAPVRVQSVSLSQAVTLVKGKTTVLRAAVAPVNAANQAVTWSTSNKKVATVDQNGKVTAVGRGTAVITVTTADGNKKASCKVTVKVPAKKVTLNTKKVYMVKGRSINLKAAFSPLDSTDRIVWSTSKKSVALVKNGKVTAKKTGKAVITAKTTSGKKASCTVYVVSKPKKAASIRLNKKSAAMKKGSVLLLKSVVKPYNTTDSVKWKTSNKKIATVDAYGNVTGKKKGKVTITAVTSSGKRATCKITVK